MEVLSGVDQDVQQLRGLRFRVETYKLELEKEQQEMEQELKRKHEFHGIMEVVAADLDFQIERMERPGKQAHNSS